MTFEYVSSTEAIRNAINSRVTWSDDIRQQAVEEIRRICQDRVTIGRRRGGDRPWISLQQVGQDRVYNAEDGVSDCSADFVELTIYAQDPETRQRLSAACERVLDFIRTTIPTDKGDVVITSCYLQDPSELNPEKIPDASSTWEFESQLIFRVTYQRTKATGLGVVA